MSRTTIVQVVTLPLEDAEAFIERAVAKALARQPSDGEMLSATKASRLVHRRTGDVLAALESGALRGKRRGRRWVVTADAARAWATSGRA